MTDLLRVLPDFPAQLFSHLLPSLDKHRVTLSDLLTLDAPDIARRAQLPTGEVRKLAAAALHRLHLDLGLADKPPQQRQPPPPPPQWQTISTLSPTLDAALGAPGIPTRYLTEIVGESGAGKTQLLLTLLLAVQLPPAHGGLGAPSIYISTESALSTARLAQLLRAHPRLAALPPAQRPSLDGILTMQTPDLESQEHILRYQLPVAIRRHRAKLVVLDSVAANFRAEFEPRHAPGAGAPDDGGGGGGAAGLGGGRRAAAGAQAMAARRAHLVQLGALLRSVAREHGVAVVVANQVADRFGHETPFAAATTAAAAEDCDPPATPTGASLAKTQRNGPTSAPQGSAPAPAPAADAFAPLPQQQQQQPLSTDPMTLDHQQRFFTGWGDGAVPAAHSPPKTPALGLVWANQIACRVALLRQQAPAHGPRRRLARVVFCAWAAPSPGRGVEYAIWEGGVRAVADDGVGLKRKRVGSGGEGGEEGGDAISGLGR